MVKRIFALCLAIAGLALGLLATASAQAQEATTVDPNVIANLVNDALAAVGPAKAAGILGVALAIVGVVVKYLVDLIKYLAPNKWASWSNLVKVLVAFASAFLATWCVTVVAALLAGQPIGAAALAAVGVAFSAALPVGLSAMGLKGALKASKEPQALPDSKPNP